MSDSKVLQDNMVLLKGMNDKMNMLPYLIEHQMLIILAYPTLLMIFS